MKRVINGQNQDTTDTVVSWLSENRIFHFATLYLIGEREDPAALWLTDWESPLLWSLWGEFIPARIERGNVTSKIGLEVSSLELTWSPRPETGTAYYEAVAAGSYDNWRVRTWTAYMPTPGDCDTLGCSELFGGRVGKAIVDRGIIRITVNSFLDVINQLIPNQVIESTNPLLAFEEDPADDWGFHHIPAPEQSV